MKKGEKKGNRDLSTAVFKSRGLRVESRMAGQRGRAKGIQVSESVDRRIVASRECLWEFVMEWDARGWCWLRNTHFTPESETMSLFDSGSLVAMATKWKRYSSRLNGQTT